MFLHGRVLTIQLILSWDRFWLLGHHWTVIGVDRSEGDYRLVVTGDDAVLKWNGMSYWKLSMEPKAFPDSNLPVSFLALNGTGLFLLGSDKSTILINLG